MSKSNKDPPKKGKKCYKKLRLQENESCLLINNLAETLEKLLEGDCKKKSKKKSKEKSSCKKCRECVRGKSKKAKKKRSSSEGACGGVGSEDEPRNELDRTSDEGPDDGDELNAAMQVESSSEFEDPRPGCSRDPAPQGCRRKRRLQRRPAERPNDSSSSSCSPQQQQQQQQRKSRGKKPSPQKCAQNERSNATFIVRTSPVKEQCESNENKADSSLGDRPQIQRLRMQLIDKVRTKAPNVQEQVKRAIRMMKLDELEKFDRKTRGQTKFTKAQCDQFMRMYDEWQNSIKVKKFVARSIKGPVEDYWDRRREQRQSELAAATTTTSLFDQAPRVAAPAAAAATGGGYSPIQESSGEWRTPPRQQVRTRRRSDLGARRKIEFSSESDSDGESRPRVRPRRRRPRSKDNDDGSP